jgi:hypothetical protein
METKEKMIEVLLAKMEATTETNREKLKVLQEKSLGQSRKDMKTML